MRNKRWFVIVASLFLVISLTALDIPTSYSTVYAKKSEKESDKDKEEELTEEEKYELELKKEKAARKKIPIESNALAGWPKGPKSYCQSGVMMDLDSGTVLYEKNINEKLYPASITKVLTALVALENCDLDEKIKFSQDSIDILGNGYANIGMKPGEKITMEDALYAMMLASANEVAYAICEYFGGGDYANGLAMLNERARELGCTDSNFVNPNGIHDENHKTTAHDMALIAQAAYRLEVFRKIVSTKQYTIKKTNKCKEERTFQNHHKMLWGTSDYYYEYCVGGKTGYTSEAQNTLVTFAEKDGRHLLCVTLETRGPDTYEDTKKILQYGFERFQTLSIEENETDQTISANAAGMYVTIPAGVGFRDLDKVTADGTGGTVYTYYGYRVGACGVAEPATTGSVESVIETQPSDTSDGNDFQIASSSDSEDTVSEKKKIDKKKIILAVVGAVLILLIIVRMIVGWKRWKKKRRRRRNRRRKRR